MWASKAAVEGMNAMPPKSSSEEKSEDEGAAHYCLRCGHSLLRVEDNRRPECGRTFDPNDPRTYGVGRSADDGTGMLWGLNVTTSGGTAFALFATVIASAGGSFGSARVAGWVVSPLFLIGLLAHIYRRETVTAATLAVTSVLASAGSVVSMFYLFVVNPDP